MIKILFAIFLRHFVIVGHFFKQLIIFLTVVNKKVKRQYLNVKMKILESNENFKCLGKLEKENQFI